MPARSPPDCCGFRFPSIKSELGSFMSGLPSLCCCLKGGSSPPDPLHQLRLEHRDVAFLRDDEVVEEDPDAQDVARLPQPCRDVQVLLARGCVSGRVVVRHDDRREFDVREASGPPSPRNARPGIPPHPSVQSPCRRTAPVARHFSCPSFPPCPFLLRPFGASYFPWCLHRITPVVGVMEEEMRQGSSKTTAPALAHRGRSGRRHGDAGWAAETGVPFGDGKAWLHDGSCGRGGRCPSGRNGRGLDGSDSPSGDGEGRRQWSSCKKPVPVGTEVAVGKASMALGEGISPMDCGKKETIIAGRKHRRCVNG